MTTLFRRKALRAQRHRLLGSVILTQPVSFSVICGFIAVAFLAIVALLLTGTYTKKERVFGFVSPTGGIAKVSAPRRGVIDKVLVGEGQSVSTGDALLTFRDARHSAEGIAVDDEILQALDAQIREIEVRKELVLSRARAKNVLRITELKGLEEEHTSILAQIETQQQLLTSLETSYARSRSLHGQGFVNDTELSGHEEQLLLARQNLAKLQRDVVVNQSRWHQVRLSADGMDVEVREHLSQLATQRAEATLRRADRSAQQSLTIVTPTAGIVTAIHAISGSATDPGSTLLSILPHDSSFLAELIVPTRAVGFLRPGQQVRLLYDAFDYRRFGGHTGVITAVSSTVISPADFDTAYRISEPSYRVLVKIERSHVIVYGQRFFLRSGMTLQADIVLETRSLIDWFLVPLTSALRRT